MPRRLFASLFLAFALLLGQLGGAAHALSHYAGQGEQDRPHTGCQLCVAYSAMDAGVLPAGLPPLVAGVDFIAVSLCRVPAGAVRLPPYSSRAPPHLV